MWLATFFTIARKVPDRLDRFSEIFILLCWFQLGNCPFNGYIGIWTRTGFENGCYVGVVELLSCLCEGVYREFRAAMGNDGYKALSVNLCIVVSCLDVFR